MTKFISLIFILFSCLLPVSAQEPVIGGPCQGCELVFVGMPTELKTHSRIGPQSVKGEALKLSGVVFKSNGTPAAEIIVYAYQTDNQGHYPKGDTWHGGLRGWAISDAKGHYSFDTIRPKAYPGREIPQHIHLHVIEPNKGTYYIDDVTFDDDPLLTDEDREKTNCRGGCVLSQVTRDQNGAWIVSRDIVLGESIPNYKKL